MTAHLQHTVRNTSNQCDKRRVIVVAIVNLVVTACACARITHTRVAIVHISSSIVVVVVVVVMRKRDNVGVGMRSHARNDVSLRNTLAQCVVNQFHSVQYAFTDYISTQTDASCLSLTTHGSAMLRCVATAQ
jgi:hypothetical protein